MDGLFTLLVLSLLMAIVSFVIGSLPLSFSLSSSQLRLISSLGMGVLVGTSLIVIIPEGVETLYSSVAVSHTHHNKRDVNIVNEGINRALDTRWEHPVVNTLVIRRDTSQAEAPAAADSPETIDSGESGEGGRLNIPGDHRDYNNGKTQAKEKYGAKSKPRSPHAWVGIALISGFILMYLIDTLPSVASASSKHQQRPYHISLDNLGFGLGLGSAPSRNSGGLLATATTSSAARHDFAITTGLAIHAAADGVALGASISSTSLSLIIFMAIMVHKAPAAFGLTTALLKQGLSTRAIRGHLLIFSLAAPVGAFLTWIVAHTVMAGQAGDELATRWRTGILLLFSAGTFLYVAMHTMQETGATTEMSRRDSSYANGYVVDGRENAQRTQHKSMRDLIATVVGMILPVFLQIGHAH
ncbi:solute carrier family 39 (zinc transporter), member 9 [Blastomyces parvus]|uniref:Solute carrier family 39 (Zinc transporter), member 9 n=1 Tax=Blastomyces parvus TaxID=2060905 RepID=A0A2B7WT65_9EURO|nr:solute carrier family 39 (zinc transporter), member 9 [Blastomyces parvus]